MNQLVKKIRKYNNQTGCYKIDIFINGCYACSTDQAKSCKEAVKRYCDKWVIGETEKVTAHYYYQSVVNITSLINKQN